MSLKSLDNPSICCPISDARMEPNNHLFFKCSVAKTVLAKILAWWGLQSYSFDTVADCVDWIENLRIKKQVKEVLERAFLVTWWYH